MCSRQQDIPPWSWYVNHQKPAVPNEVMILPNKQKMLPCFKQRRFHRYCATDLTRDEKLYQQQLAIINVYKSNGDEDDSIIEKGNYNLACKLLDAKPVVSSFRKPPYEPGAVVKKPRAKSTKAKTSRKWEPKIKPQPPMLPNKKMPPVEKQKMHLLSKSEIVKAYSGKVFTPSRSGEDKNDIRNKNNILLDRLLNVQASVSSFRCK